MKGYFKKVVCFILLSMTLLLTACTEGAGKGTADDSSGTTLLSGTTASGTTAIAVTTADGINSEAGGSLTVEKITQGSSIDADNNNTTLQNQTDLNSNIIISTPMTISNNLIQFKGTDAYLRLKMVSGKYYEDWSPGAYMGTIWEGSFILELSDVYGKTLTQTDLREYYTEPLTFTGKFQLEFDDYNDDGNPDFTLGQYASSNGSTYKLFTINPDGTVEGLLIKDRPELFITSSAVPYSVRLQKYSSIAFKERYYDNSQGKNYECVYEWRDGVFTGTGTREIKSLEGYYEILSDPAIDPKDMLEYIRKNIGNSMESDAANLLLRLELRQGEYQEQLVDRYYNGDYFNSEFNSLDINDTEQNNIDNIKDSKLRELLTDIRSNGFKLVRVEGGLYPIIDYSIYNEFNQYLPEDLRSYFTLMAMDSEQIPAMDAGLVISWSELIKRALAQEQFILTYDRSQKWIEVQALFKEYVRYLFFSLPNTPDFEYETKIMDPELKKCLLDVAARKGESPLEKAITDYLDVLIKNKYKLTDEVEQFRQTAAEELSKDR